MDGLWKSYCSDGSKAYVLSRMKRLTWLLLAVFCTVVVQVQGVEGPAKAKAGACCPCGGCGMPCCPPPASAAAAFIPDSSALVARLPAPRRVPGSRWAETFYASFAEPEAFRSALPASAEAARAAGVPLFKAHCSFLI